MSQRTESRASQSSVDYVCKYAQNHHEHSTAVQWNRNRINHHYFGCRGVYVE